MQHYEVMAIIDSALDNDGYERNVDKMTALITKEGGKVNKADKWGRKKLAYEIKHKSEGFYVLVDFHGTPPVIEELARVLHITDDVIRHRIVRLPA